MFNATINLLLILIANMGLVGILAFLVYEIKEHRHPFDVFLATVFALFLIKGVQFAFWAATALYDKYIEGTIQVTAIINV